MRSLMTKMNTSIGRDGMPASSTAAVSRLLLEMTSCPISAALHISVMSVNPRILRLLISRKSGGMTNNSSRTPVSQHVNDALCMAVSTFTQLPRSHTLGVRYVTS